MSEQNLLKMFQGILSSQSFELLSYFSDEVTWSTLKQEEKEALAQLFLIHGEKCIHAASFKGDLSKAKRAFDSACRLMPQSAKTWFRYGSYLALSENIDDLHESIQSLKRSIELDSRFFDAHYALASVQLRLGSQINESSFLQNADHSFYQAYQLVDEGQGQKVPLEFCWHWGIVHFLSGRMHGEPSDFQRALELYKEAYEKGFRKAEFFNDFANALVEFSLLLGSNESIEKAASLYEEALRLDQEEKKSSKEQAIRCFNAGCCYVHLFESTFNRKYFHLAEAAFLRTLVLEPFEMLFHKMGHLYFLAARSLLKREYVEKAIDCFQKAYALGIAHPVMLAYYSQALLMLYEQTEKPHLLHDAERIANCALEQQRETMISSPEPLIADALCLYEKGKYFHEISLMNKAEEALQKALTLYPKSAYLWYSLGLMKSALALMDQNADLLRESTICFSFASRSTLCTYSHFWNSWGIALLSLADMTEEPLLAEEACSKFERAIELSNFSECDWIYNMGCALDLLGFLQDEEDLHEQAIQLFLYVEKEDPTFYEVLLQQAVAYIHLGDIRESRADYERAEELLYAYLREEGEDEFAWLELGIATLHKALLLDNENELWLVLSEAEKAFHQVLALGNAVGYYHLARICCLLKNFPEAMEYLWKAQKEEALPSVKDLVEDELFEPLFLTKPFLQLLQESVRED